MFSLFFFNLFAVVINTQKSAFIDMERLFNEYKKTKEGRLDIENRKDKYKKELDLKNKEYLELNSQYNKNNSVDLKSDSKVDSKIVVDEDKSYSNGSFALDNNLQVYNNMAAAEKIDKIDANESNTDLKEKQLKENENIKSQLKKKKKEIEDYKDNFKDDIEKLEHDLLYNITAEIYEKISDFATKNSYSIIFDKKDLVYSNGTSDLTDVCIDDINSI